MTNGGEQVAKESEELILKQLKKSFKVVNVQAVQWMEHTSKSKILIDSLANFCEQRICCQKASKVQNNPVVEQFPDLGSKLDSSLLHSMELVMNQLQDHMLSLQEIRKKICRQYNNSMELYNKHYLILGLETVTRRSATCPSIADMLEWLSDLSRLFTQQYALRSVQLEKIRYKDEETIKELKLQFKDEKITSYLQDNVLKLAFFLESD